MFLDKNILIYATQPEFLNCTKCSANFNVCWCEQCAQDRKARIPYCDYCSDLQTTPIPFCEILGQW